MFNVGIKCLIGSNFLCLTSFITCVFGIFISEYDLLSKEMEVDTIFNSLKSRVLFRKWMTFLTGITNQLRINILSYSYLNVKNTSLKQKYLLFLKFNIKIKYIACIISINNNKCIQFSVYN